MFAFLTFELGQETLAAAPLQLKDVEAGEILQVHQNHHQRVQLIGEPEVRKLHPVERRREDAKLETEPEGRRSKMSRAFLLKEKKKKSQAHFRTDCG